MFSLCSKRLAFAMPFAIAQGCAPARPGVASLARLAAVRCAGRGGSALALLARSGSGLGPCRRRLVGAASNRSLTLSHDG